jgi:RNA polymerase sigma-70 factor (ECF subfamily)
VSPDERFEDLYRAHYAAVLRFARRRTDPATAEDVAAETFAIAWRRLERIPPENPLPWLYTTAANELANRRRKARSDEYKAAAASHEIGRDPADALAERDAVLRAFAELSATDREALRLVAWEGLSLADGARVAKTTRVAFAVRVSRARKRLAARLEAQAAAPPARPTARVTGPPPSPPDPARAALAAPSAHLTRPRPAAPLSPTAGADHVR